MENNIPKLGTKEFNDLASEVFGGKPKQETLEEAKSKNQQKFKTIMDLIKEAKQRGYKKGTAIRYVSHAIDYVEGNYFEVENGELKAYAKPEHERKSFDDFRHDTLFDGKQWVEIVKQQEI
jgi:hypothetical protein